jgi:hypothetical protein
VSLHPVGRGEDNDVGRDRLGPVDLDAITLAFGRAGERRAGDHGKFDVRASRHRLEQALADIFAEQLPRQEGMGERLMQAGLVLALIELMKGPVQEIAWLARTD